MNEQSTFQELVWVANYTDGTTFPQFDDQGRENKYANINREKLERFDMLNKQTKKLVLSVYLREGQKLIFRRRTLMHLDGSKYIIFIVGWNIKIYTNSGPKDFVTLNYIHEDGSVALDGARNNIQLLDFEK